MDLIAAASDELAKQHTAEVANTGESTAVPEGPEGQSSDSLEPPVTFVSTSRCTRAMAFVQEHVVPRCEFTHYVGGGCCCC